MEWTAQNETENEAVADALLNAFPENRIFCLTGNLGAGKTTFSKSLCKTLGVSELVSSPTFSIINEYEGLNEPVYHFDFYRLKSEAEAWEIGCEDYFYSGCYCFMEWAEKIPNLIPEDALWIEIKIGENGNRTFSVTEKNKK